jgi:uncharacterized protein (TIGR02246 family)
MIGSIGRAAVIAAFLAALAACSERAPGPTSSAASEADVAAIGALVDRVERTFKAGDLEAAMTVFTDDAVIIAQGAPDMVGTDTIRAMYAGMMDQFDIDADLSTAEIQVVGDLAYERGTYTLKLTDKASGQVVMDVVNRHLHILKRQPDGTWKTWRMMVNSAEPAAGAQ